VGKRKRSQRVKKVDIRIRMLTRGLTQDKLAAEAGVTRQTINAVLAGRLHSERIQGFIAEKLGFPLKSLFPGCPVKE
jgi:DNA-binding XRE family transcriptional regulator